MEEAHLYAELPEAYSLVRLPVMSAGWKVATENFRDFKVDPESSCLSSRSCLAVAQVAPSWAVLWGSVLLREPLVLAAFELGAFDCRVDSGVPEHWDLQRYLLGHELLRTSQIFRGGI